MTKYCKGSRDTWKHLFSSKDEAWRTPKYVFDYYNKVYKFNFDAAATPDNALTRSYLTKHENALEESWCRKGSKRKIWLNPPYSRHMYPWLEKAWKESEKGCLVAVLLFARTDTKWWHEIVMKHAWKIHFIKGRLKFLHAKTGKEAKSGATAPSCVVVFKRHRGKSPTIVSDERDKMKKSDKR